MNKFKYPDHDACLSILDKLEVDKSSLLLDCQDWEYTLANENYLPEYVKLYESDTTSALEKRVLGCFIIQSIENLLPKNVHDNEIHSYLSMLNKDNSIHKDEFIYWSLLEEQNPENWFYVTSFIRELNNA